MITFDWEGHLPRNKTKAVFFRDGAKIGEILLSPQSGNIYFVEDSHFERTASSEERELVWKMFCQEIRERKLFLLLSCRSAQNFFVSHPEYADLISSSTKTKPGF